MSTLHVENLKGLSSGSNANKVIIPTGQTLEVADNLRHDDMPTGSVIQTVSVTYGTSTTTTSTSFVDTGLTASITPRFSSSKILISVSQAFSMVGPDDNQYQSNLVITDGSNNNLFGHTVWDQFRIKNMIAIAWQANLQYLHSPSTTSAFTYKTRMKAQYGTGNNVYAQMDGSDSNITLMEIKQ